MILGPHRVFRGGLSPANQPIKNHRENICDTYMYMYIFLCNFNRLEIINLSQGPCDTGDLLYNLLISFSNYMHCGQMWVCANPRS